MRLDHLVRLISQQWAIQPDVLENWCQILDAKLSGHSIPAEFTAAIGKERAGEQEEPFIRDGNIAIVPLVGTLVKANSWFSCDATYAAFKQDLLAAERAKGIDAIVIDGDTPGGTVAGVVETGDFLAQLNQRKPLFGWVDDLAASAGYWLMAQTRMIGAHAGADIGSIGVLTVAYDRSGRDKQSGVVRTVLAVGDFKASGNDTGPLTKEAEAYIMERLNQTYSLFKGAVNKGRPQLSLAAIHDMQSRVYKAEQAKGLNLIDHVMGRDEYLALVKRQLKGAVSVTVPSKGAKAMDMKTLKAEHPDLVTQIETEARAGMVLATVAATAQATAVSAESTRILSLVSATLGAETGDKISAIAGANLSAEQITSLGITVAPAASGEQAKMLAAITGAAPNGVAPAKVVVAPEAKGSSINTSGIYANRQKVMHRK
jgi:signal peptide peptidase SppA